MALKSLASKFGKGAVTKQMYVYETWLRWAARGIQFVFAIIVCGIYGHRLDQDRRAGNTQSVNWVYAVVVAGLSCITCLLYAIPNPFSKLQSHRLFAWDLVLFILWIAVFGTFANIFLKRTDDEFEGTSVKLMKCAIWVDLVNAVFWIFTGIYGAMRTCVGKKANAKIDHYQDAAESRINARVDQYSSSMADKMSNKFHTFKTETV
ncbi:hypothetical protein F4779DRAFT_581382 [Xylariaceae sp. FL0662B]|nr:hypothetical protein F4779DRAFT_581382 [Xylariaceae sp. FL0662B]